MRKMQKVIDIEQIGEIKKMRRVRLETLPKWFTLLGKALISSNYTKNF